MFYFIHALLPKKLLSALMYRLARIRVQWAKNALIKLFMACTGASLHDAARKNIADYDCLLDFFTRELEAGARPVDADSSVIASPVDGTVAHVGPLLAGDIYQIKGHHYPLSDLLGHDYAADYLGGEATTIYLAPYNYHRIHFPEAGKLLRAKYIPGELNSVSIGLLDKITGLFARNERVICEFAGENGRFLMVLVGAVNVGSIETVMHGQITPNCNAFPQDLPGSDDGFAKGDELGRFNLGSTIIYIREPQADFAWQNLSAGQRVQMGQNIGLISSK